MFTVGPWATALAERLATAEGLGAGGDRLVVGAGTAGSDRAYAAVAVPDRQRALYWGDATAAHGDHAGGGRRVGLKTRVEVQRWQFPGGGAVRLAAGDVG